MKIPGFVLVGLVLAATPALAQSSPQDNTNPQSQRMQELITPPSGPEQDQQQAALTPSGDMGDMLSAIRDSAKIGQQIDALGPLPDDKVELRDAYAIEQSGNGGSNVDQLQQAINDNRQSVQDLRQSLIRNKSVDLALSRDQVPLTNVVAANIQPDGKVVVYAYPQDRVPPK
ncbi:MAG TPA: hypothetical protein VK558_03930 [Patescibacteria group bacterium]|nr:hypothetical protein [Patescibacteria group bacterium]